jgi:hypothetical protein
VAGDLDAPLSQQAPGRRADARGVAPPLTGTAVGRC